MGVGMITHDDVQSFFDRLDLTVETTTDDLWLVRTPDGTQIAVQYAPPVVVLRIRVMALPADPIRAGELGRKLLEYNARDLVRGAYGVEGNDVVLTAAMELDRVDFTDFEASVDSLSLALASHLGSLAPYRES